MGSCMSVDDADNDRRANTTTAAGGTSGAHSNDKKSKVTSVNEETSTVIRENLINLHARAKRQSVERQQLLVEERENPAVTADDGDEEPPPKMVEKPEAGNYKRLKNVFAAPLQIVPDYSAPKFPKSEAETEFLERCLHDNFVFSGLTGKERTLLVTAMEHFHASQGDIIIQQGDIGDFFYVLQRGTVSFMVNGKTVGKARKGGSFGELALLYNSPRAATAKADTDCTLFRVDQNTFRMLLANNNAQAANENVQVLRRVELFQGMDTRTLTKISDSLSAVTFHDGEFVLRKGETGRVFYIIKQGKVVVSDIGGGEKKYLDQTLSVGDFFGERALLTGEKRAANVKAVGDCVMLCLSKDTFEKILGPLQNLLVCALDKRKLMGVPAVAKAQLEPYEIDLLSKRLQFLTFRKGETLVHEGDDYTKIDKGKIGLLFIKEGKLTVTSSKGGVQVVTKGDYFGEIFLRKKTPRSPTTVVATEETTCNILTLDDMEQVIGGVDRLGTTSSIMANKLNPMIKLEDLTKHTILGAGTFGQVWLVSHAVTKDTYALKIQVKRDLIKNNQVEGVIREKNLMASLDHPFVIKLVNSFQDERNLFMVMMLVQGGELFSAIHTETSDGVEEPAAKFYAACVLEGLSHLHHRHILYRDLKPENVLIDQDGYCVLIDLGFAKVVTDKTYTLCGTPLYLAPEIILSRGYDKGVDHWAFAVLVFEMLMGYSPFYSHKIDQMTLFKRIVKVQYTFPDWCECSAEAQDMIERILVLKQTERLGSFAGGDKDIRDHPWLKEMKPERLVAKKLKAPWVPQLNNPLDVSNFENWNHLEDKQKNTSPPPSEKEQQLFKDF